MPVGTLYIISAPSGAGKTSLVSQLLENTTDVTVAVSHTTRLPRPNEKNGEHYHFVSHAIFKTMAEKGAFLEHAQVFGNYYGTSRDAALTQLDNNLDVILEIDWQGAQQVRALIPDSLSIFILPPSLESLRQRLADRNQDSLETINRRIAESLNELSHYPEFDYLVINDDFATALNTLRAIIIANRQRCSVQLERQKEFLSTITNKSNSLF
ncbi:MAG: guanylate kinase [Candidatus Contendobacter odensis]|uniref:Guanylate kinase n=1 Tax=Candidatus Contendibacter odensensis TaxID=1400860 RepID=A0A2G6PDS2_9GAMM|nr:MAG: guanylate kinase [Candidatus Contendobacter odensis]